MKNGFLALSLMFLTVCGAPVFAGTSPSTASNLITTPHNADKVKTNSAKPIFYGLGAGGITFNTSYPEAQMILSPRNRIDATGIVVYEEGLLIQWTGAPPYVAKYIVILAGYQGKLQAPNPWVAIDQQQDFSVNYPEKSQASAEKMALDFYRMFENASADDNCLQTGRCKITWNANKGEFFVIELPGLHLQFIKDTMVLNSMIVINPNI